ncbi:MAG: hypothetical protein ACO1NS_11215 [Daejeonella sp.]
MNIPITHDFTKFNEQLVIHFGVDNHIINAETLGVALIGFSNSIKVIDAAVNSGYQIEFLIEATGQGSFKVLGKTVRTSLDNLFSKAAVNAIALNLFASFLWYWMQPRESVNIIVNSDTYVVEHGDERIILPKEAGEYFDSIKNNKKVQEEITATFKTLQDDIRVSNVELHSIDKNSIPELIIARENFAVLSSISIDKKVEGDVEVDASLVIIKAILEKSLRRWQFKWGHRRISAPILDFDFYNDFGAHKFTIAPGDTLEVRLRIVTETDPELGITTEKYHEIMKVYKHHSKHTSHP